MSTPGKPSGGKVPRKPSEGHRVRYVNGVAVGKRWVLMQRFRYEPTTEEFLAWRRERDLARAREDARAKAERDAIERKWELRELDAQIVAIKAEIAAEKAKLAAEAAS